MTLALTRQGDGFDLHLDGRLVVRHRAATPFLFAGQGEARMDMLRGNFDISDYLVARVPLGACEIAPTDAGWTLAFAAAGQAACITATLDAARATLRFATPDPAINRLWLRLHAEADEPVWGCGEQMSYFDLRGRRFPIWTSEPGVGRDRTTEITWRADVEGRAGGDYHTTNYPQPSFLSARRYAAHLDTPAYAAFDFRHPGFHEIEVWAIPEALEFFAAPSFLELVAALSDRFGRAAPLPDWVLDGAIIGLKDGAASFDRLQTVLDAGAHVAGLWCEDWCGIRETSFGKRLFWDWRWNPARYPDMMARAKAMGVRLLGYINPYLCNDGSLFPLAKAAGYFATAADGGTALVDFGEFECGVIDFTNPAACDWFAGVIGTQMIDFGLSGWMADFGEYLPIDVRLANGVDAALLHNPWPVLWAEVNARAIAASGRQDLLFFMRAGHTGVQRHCPLLWAGDQCVDFSRHDGLQTVICGALSSGLLGNPFHHSDIGGYTSLYGLHRTVELMQRWAEMAAFTPVMRTHEGNRPAENLQIDQDPAVLAHFAVMTRLHSHLAPYLRGLFAEAQARGIPLQRPLFLHFEQDPACLRVQDQYLLGPDLLVAPVHAAGALEWPVTLPAGAAWVHVWTGVTHQGGSRVVVPAPIAEIPVFWRAGSPHGPLFADLRRVRDAPAIPPPTARAGC